MEEKSQIKLWETVKALFFVGSFLLFLFAWGTTHARIVQNDSHIRQLQEYNERTLLALEKETAGVKGILRAETATVRLALAEETARVHETLRLQTDATFAALEKDRKTFHDHHSKVIQNHEFLLANQAAIIKALEARPKTVTVEKLVPVDRIVYVDREVEKIVYVEIVPCKRR